MLPFLQQFAEKNQGDPSQSNVFFHLFDFQDQVLSEFLVAPTVRRIDL